jgi:hypothetical protein
VKVSLVNTATNARRDVVTNQEGYFVLPQLEPGKYKLQAMREGFAIVEIRDIVLNTADRREIQIRLKVGTANESISVVAEVALVPNETGGQGTLVTRGFVENTALNGRSFQPLLALTPGAVLDANTGNISVNGMRSNMNYFTLDGVSVTAGANRPDVGVSSAAGADIGSLAGALPGLNTFGGTQGMLGLDAMEEFKVQDSAITAQYGRQMGAQVQLKSRSGTNQFHGSAYDYLRNDALDAKPVYPDDTSKTKPKMRQNNFGGTFGGPIIKDKTFFFFAYEGQRNILPKQQNFYLVPSAALRNGDLHLLDSYNAAGYPLPSSPQMNSMVSGILKMFPLPNVPCQKNGIDYTPSPSNPLDCQMMWETWDYSADPPTKIGDFPLVTGMGIWQGSLSDRANMNNYSVKLDHVLTSRLTAFVRYSRAFSDGLTHSDAISQTLTTSTNRAATLGLDWAATNTVGNSLRANVTEAKGSGTYGTGSLHDGGIAPGANPMLDYITSNFTTGFVNLGIPALSTGANRGTGTRQWNIVDDLTWVRSKHQLRAGFDWRYLHSRIAPNSYVNLGLPLGVEGLFSNSFQDLSMWVSDGGHAIISNYSSYIQDTWRVTPRLTLDLGVRWDINPAPKGANPGDMRFVTGWINPGSMTLAPAGTDYYNTPWTAFAPRIGASYKLFGRNGWETVLRGGWGVFNDLGGDFGLNSALFYPAMRQQYFLNWNPTPLDDVTTWLAKRPDANTEQPPYPFGQNYVARMDKLDSLPNSQQWNLSLQQGLGTFQNLTVSYVGNIGRNLIRNVRFIENGLYAQTPTFNSPNFRYSNFFVARNDRNWGDTSDYQALQVQYQRRMSKGLEVLSNYTWAHAIDTNSSSDLDSTVSPSMPAVKFRGNSDFDRRHVFNVAMNYQPPTLTNLGPVVQPLATIVKSIVNGWSFASAFKAQSGTPMSVTFTRDLMPFDIGQWTVRADRVAGQPVWVKDPTVAGGRYLNWQAFAVPASCMTMNQVDCQNGNSARNGIVGFGFWQTDASVRRTFPIEKVNIEFRADFFNLLNHPNWANPGGSIGYVGYDWWQNPPVWSLHGYLEGQKGPQSGNMLGNSINGGLTSMYQQGNARSIQLALRLTF